MSLREIALRVPDTPAPDADVCPSCAWFDLMAAQHTEHPTIRRRLATWWEQHVNDGECLAVADDAE
ncbi:hypothetical protein [Streptomyces sp. MJM8645]|uniref:hypothetical protein n=1 Tax=Streptomyces sp. MJM8645 TaxID=1120523 RepID=UPI0007AEECBC|nr:hypothetical protein [Streptomyces sp. MJM8645]